MTFFDSPAPMAKRIGSKGGEGALDPKSTPPKLTFSSLPAKRTEPEGLATPPLMLPVSVPFRWEEAPGKPRRETNGPPPASVARCLNLPPRLVAAEEEAKASRMAVLDGPYLLDRHGSSCYSFSFGEERRLRDIRDREGKSSGRKGRVVMWFGKGRKEEKWEVKSLGRLEDISPSSSTTSMSSWSYGYNSGDEGERGENKSGGEEEKEKNKVRITKFRRNGRLPNLSTHATSNLWANIYGSLKQVVPWTRDRKN